MALSKQDIEHVARLARLTLTEDEKTTYAEQLSVVLEYIALLNTVETDGVPETSQVTGLYNVFRKDVACTPDDAVREKLVEQFPKRRGELLEVHAVFD